MVMCRVSTNDGTETLVECLFPLFETVLYIGSIFSSLLVLEIFIQILLLINFTFPRKKEGKLYGSGEINCDLFLLCSCLRHRYDKQSAVLVLAGAVGEVWTCLGITEGDPTNNRKHSLLTFDKDYSYVIIELEKLMKNITVSFKAKVK
jgi:hypothetical protein